MRIPGLPALCGAMLLGCGPGQVVVEPEAGPMSGYYAIRADLEGSGIGANSVSAAVLGGVPAYDLRVDGDVVEFSVQGAPEAGPADLVLTVDGERVVVEEAFVFEPAADPVFDRMFAMGASLTQGVQGGVPTRSAQLHSPGRYISVQAGAYFALPLLNEGLFPTIDADDIGPAPGCAVPNVVDFVASAAVDVLAQINDVENDRLDFSLARVTPELEPRNVAVGGSKVDVVVNGPRDDFATGFLAKLVYDVHADIADDVDTSQLQLVEAADPTLVILTDTYGNDLIGAVVEGSGIDPFRLTPEDEVRASLQELLDRLAATGAEVFIANMARATVLPVTDEKIRSAVDAARSLAEQNGTDPEAAAEAALAEQLSRVAQVDEMGAAYNAALVEIAAGHGNVHVVDFEGAVEDIERDGFDAGLVHLSTLKLDGLLSTDGVHFSDTGYAMLANLFIDAIDAELGVSLPRVDLGAIVVDDPFSPDNLRAAGLEPEACDPR